MEQCIYITANTYGKSRRVTVNGRDYIIAPVTLIVSGVLNGSSGPIWYPPEELSRDPSRWDGMPLVVYHPTDEFGKPISARSPSVMSKSEIGRVYNTTYDTITGKARLKAEAWFDVELTNKIDKRVINSLEKEEKIEVSTGLTLSAEEAVANSQIDGVSYTHIARHFQPDHLAILPDQRGACAVEHGCGVFNRTKLSHSELRDQLQQALNPVSDSNSLSADYDWDNFCHIMDVYDKEVVYMKGSKFWKRNYTTDLRGGTVSLGEGDPVEVRRVVSYKDVTNNTTSQDGTTTTTITKIPHVTYEEVISMNRTAMISFIVANCTCWNKPSDKEVLDKMSDDHVQRIYNVVKTEHDNKQVTPPTTPPVTPPVAPPVATPVNTPTNNQATITPEMMKQMVTDITASIVPQITTTVINNMKQETEKGQLVTRLTAGINDPAAKTKATDVYNTMTVEQLRPLAELAPVVSPASALPPSLQAMFTGAGGAPITANQADDFDPNDILPMPGDPVVNAKKDDTKTKTA